MKSTKYVMTFLLIMFLTTSLATATEVKASGGDESVSIGHEYTGLKDLLKQMFSNPFSTVGAQTNIWVADNFVIGDFGSVKIDISGEKYTYNQGANLKILSFFSNPRGQNIRMKVFKVDKLNNNNLVLDYDTGNYKTDSSWTWSYWITTRNNHKAGSYVVRSYYNDNVVKAREYTVKPLPPSITFNVKEIYQTDSNLNLNLLASKGSVNIYKYEIYFGDGNKVNKIINTGTLNAEINHQYTNKGDYTISTTITDTEMNEYTSSHQIKIVDAGMYSDTILDYEKYQNIDSNGLVNVKTTLTPNLERHYRVLIDGELIYNSDSKITNPRGFERQVELFIGRHDITAESSYDGISYVEVYNGVLYARYIPTIAYNTNYVNLISGTLEHNNALIETEILLYKNGEYLNKADTINGYYSFSELDGGVYNVIFMGNDEYADVKSSEINIGDVSGIDVKKIDLNKPTLTGYIKSIINWFRGLV